MSGFLINIGRKRTFLVSGIVLLTPISLIIFFLYLISKFNNYYKCLLDDILKEILTTIFFLILLFFTFKGKKWSKNILLSFLLIKIYFSLKFTAYISTNPFEYKFNNYYLLSAIIVYITAILHFAFSKSFKVFSKHQNSK